LSFYRTCQHCGSNLDHGERCDCQEPKERIDRIMSTENMPHDLHRAQVLRPLAPHFYKLEDI